MGFWACTSNTNFSWLNSIVILDFKEQDQHPIIKEQSTKEFKDKFNTTVKDGSANCDDETKDVFLGNEGCMTSDSEEEYDHKSIEESIRKIPRASSSFLDSSTSSRLFPPINNISQVNCLF